MLPPKMLVRRRMKVDLPQPESAATPIRMTFSPSPSFIMSCVKELALAGAVAQREAVGCPRKLAGARKADAPATPRRATAAVLTCRVD